MTRTLLPSVGLFGSVKYDIAATCCHIDAVRVILVVMVMVMVILMSMIITKELGRFTNRSRTILNLPMQLWLPGSKLDNLDNNLLKTFLE